MRFSKKHCRAFVLTVLAGFAVCGHAPPSHAQVGHFDLMGPKIDVHVTRGERSLPIASVPNLQPGDKLQIRADLPTTQSVKLLLVVAFLRGSTNPPPDKWFTRIETWDKHMHTEGVTVPVPDEAQQALLFIAPETGGDFSTLKSAVRGRPGTFVRASQDLNEASFEQSRIERYAQALLQVPAGSPEQLLDHSRKLAATLNLRPNDDCFKRPPDLQLACLRQSGTQLLLDDGHGETLAQILSTGATSDLIGAVAGTPVATAGGAASYSAYVGTVLDVVRLMTNLHTAHFQYIPAIAFPDADSLNLRLNTAPSFHDPKSVIVIALPSIQKAVPPPLQLRDAHHVSCLLQPRMVLPLSGAPLVFATGFAHDLTLHLDHPGPDGRTDLPLVPDAYEGGLKVSTDSERKPLATSAPPVRTETIATPANQASAPPASRPDSQKDTASASQPAKATPARQSSSPAMQTASAKDSNPIEISGTVRGFWGFDPFNGPTVPLQRLPGNGWTSASHTELFAGRSNDLDLHADGTACVESVALETAPDQKLDWHHDDNQGVRNVDVKLPLEKSAPGGLTLLVRQYGRLTPDKVNITAYSDAMKPQELRIHAGDSFATLLGTGLPNVKSVDLNGTAYLPSPDQSPDGKSLHLTATPPASAAPSVKDARKDNKGKPPVFKVGDHGTAQIALNDGRTLPLPFDVDEARPAFTLLSKTATAATESGFPLTLSDKEAIPLNTKLSFAIRSDSPSKFARSEKVEVATTDGSLHTTLSLNDRTLVLQDSRTALGYLSPANVFGPSAFGALQLRVITEDGNTSDWAPLGTLVRTPVIRQITCPARAAFAGRGTTATPTAPAPTPYPGTSGAPEQPETKHADTPCTVTGSDLFLIEAVSGDSAFTASADVPAGYSAETLQVPRPADSRTLYLKLRDDPEHIASLAAEITDHRAAKPPAPERKPSDSLGRKPTDNGSLATTPPQ